MEHGGVEIVERLPIPVIETKLPFFNSTVSEIQQSGKFHTSQQLIFLSRSAYEVIEKHTTKHARNGEVGGMLLGNFCQQGNVPFTMIEVAVPCERAKGSRGGLYFSPTSLAQIGDIREDKYPRLNPVGWYHSHPGFGIFMSGIDVSSHQEIFRDGLYLAAVIDPLKKGFGIFGWVSNQVRGPLAYWMVD